VRGIILAGGLGTRLDPLTRVTNKHLLPVYDRPMVLFPLARFVEAGVREILIVTGAPHAGDFLNLLGNGRAFGVERLAFAVQEGEGGIADALGLAEAFADGETVAVQLGDNLFEHPLTPHVDAWRAQVNDAPDRRPGARILLKSVPDPERFGVAELQGDRVTRIIEKPKTPPSSLAVTGCYFYDSRVFDIIRGLTPSARGELEITDVNNQYLEWGALAWSEVTGWWTDAGTIPSLHRAACLVAAHVTGEGPHAPDR
jgi:glucose-1-phosphate thymidylyltransferase